MAGHHARFIAKTAVTAEMEVWFGVSHFRSQRLQGGQYQTGLLIVNTNIAAIKLASNRERVQNWRSQVTYGK